MDLHVDIDDRGLIQAFSRAPQSVSKAMEEGVMLAGEMVADYAKAHHRFIGRTGALESSIRTLFQPPMTVIVQAGGGGAGYGAYVHGGTKAHVIRAKNKKLLRWPSPAGGFFSKREVNHPGTKADPFLFNALEAKRSEVVKQMQRAVDAALKGAGL